ncbi:hypothetical protein UlMin_005687 [Ulmus minor]
MEGSKSDQQGFSDSVFAPLIISVSGIGITSVAIIAYHFIVVRYCLRREGQQRGGVLDGSSPNIQSSKGLDEKTLKEIPIVYYTRKRKKLFRVDQTECPVCLGELEEREKVRLLPNCRHAFHVSCIDEWFRTHKNCPVCRVLPTKVSEMPLFVEDDFIDHGHVLEEGGRIVSSCVCDDERRKHALLGLERSLSDQSHVIVNIERDRINVVVNQDHDRNKTCSSKEVILSHCRSYTTRSMKRLDRVSSMFLKPFSQLRMGRISPNPADEESANNPC